MAYAYGDVWDEFITIFPTLKEETK